MEIRTFWRIIIKGIGLWLLINSIYVIPQFASSFSFIESGGLNWENLISVWFIIFGTLAVYLLITVFFLFKTEWIVRILRLDQNFTENRIDINLPYKNVLSIAVIVIGALVFVEAIPTLCSTIYEFVKQKELIKDYSGTSWLIFYFLEALSGYLIMTNSKTIIKFIDKQINDDIKP
ncbi:hypothetical protein [Flavobacterium chungbukense]|uniref:DUF4234 domain-containing protein n=1 Tax=Flavobacterium chungbukense TaxID=877464 RepID=A0ABP7Y077_9FLAO|nr:hypothetical protein [Flavobacterium chungbukense]MCC4922126.1 hypothetical protein [Flavobacterium chungbukense]